MSENGNGAHLCETELREGDGNSNDREERAMTVLAGGVLLGLLDLRADVQKIFGGCDQRNEVGQALAELVHILNLKEGVSLDLLRDADAVHDGQAIAATRRKTGQTGYRPGYCRS